MISIQKLEKAIHSNFVVDHLEVKDISSGCGESYSVLLVSEVSYEAKTTSSLHLITSRTLKARTLFRDIG
jgi:hypothetical protein